MKKIFYYTSILGIILSIFFLALTYSLDQKAYQSYAWLCVGFNGINLILQYYLYNNGGKSRVERLTDQKLREEFNNILNNYNLDPLLASSSLVPVVKEMMTRGLLNEYDKMRIENLKAK